MSIHKAARPEVEMIIENNIATVNSHWIGDLSWKGESIHDNQRCGLAVCEGKRVPYTYRRALRSNQRRNKLTVMLRFYLGN